MYEIEENGKELDYCRYCGVKMNVKQKLNFQENIYGERVQSILIVAARSQLLQALVSANLSEDISVFPLLILAK